MAEPFPERFFNLLVDLLELLADLASPSTAFESCTSGRVLDRSRVAVGGVDRPRRRLASLFLMLRSSSSVAYTRGVEVSPVQRGRDA